MVWAYYETGVHRYDRIRRRLAETGGRTLGPKSFAGTPPNPEP